MPSRQRGPLIPSMPIIISQTTVTYFRRVMLPEDSHQQLFLDLASRQRRSFEGECSRQRKCLRFLSTHRQNPSCEEEELCTRSPRVVLDGGPHQTRDSAAFLLEAGKMAIIAGHVEVKRFHLHIGGQTSLEGLIQVTHKPGCWKVSARPSARLPLKSNLSVVPTGRPKALGRPRSLQCNKTA